MREVCNEPVALFDAPLQVESISDRFGMPAGWRHEQVRMPHRCGVDALAPAVQMDGPAGSDPDVTIAAAVSTWCGEDAGQLTVVRASAARLRSESVALLTVADLNVVPGRLLDDPRCPLRRIDPEEPVRWCSAVRHPASAACRPSEPGWVPYGQVPVGFLTVHPDEPIGAPVNHSGLAAGPDEATALDRACSAAVAEDALMRWWATPEHRSAPRMERFDGVRVETAVLPDGLGGEVTLALAASYPENDGIPVVTVGAASLPDQARVRALWQHVLARTLREGTTDFAGGPPGGLLPHRPDRRYLDDGDVGLRAGTDPLASLQAGLDPRCVRAVVARFAALRRGRAHTCGRDHLGELRAAGYEAWSIDMTTPDVAPTGWRCIRVLVPGLRRSSVPSFSSAPGQLPYPGW